MIKCSLRIGISVDGYNSPHSIQRNTQRSVIVMSYSSSKKYFIILTCFVLRSLRAFNILHVSLRINLLYGPLTFFTPVDLSEPFL